MAEDFFAQGFGQEQGPIFTKQENLFFQSRIPFLDPMKTYQISMGKVLSLLKYTNLDHQTIKKIISNSCSTGIGQKIVTYDQMKKIFRGVALKQNKIEPSKINIDANIKTKLPILYDDDDQSQEEQQQKPQPQIPQRKQPQPQRHPVHVPQTQSPPVNQPPQPPKPQQQAPMNPLKAFDEYWKTIKTKNNLIDGSQVKKMFSGNNTNKNNLSKAWKLCNMSQKGVLTKGQFFIFMNLIHSPNIPDTLTKEMKDLVKQIEQASGYKKASTQPTNQRSSSTSNPVQKARSSSDAFDKFGDESLFVKKDIKVEDLSKSGIIPKSTSNVFSVPPSTLASSSILSPPPTSQNIPPNSNKNALQLLERVQNIGKQQKVHQKQISNIATNNEHMIAGLGSIQQYINMVQQNFKTTTVKIEELKQSQNSLNQRLNNVCLKFKNIITKQSECITFLMETMKFDSQSSTQRLGVLQGYTEQMINFVESNMQMTKNQVSNLQKQQIHAYQSLRNQNQQLRQKLSAGNERRYQSPHQMSKIPQSKSMKGSPQISHYSRTDPFDDNEGQEHQQRQDHNQDYQENGASSKSIQQNIQQNQQPTNHFAAQSTTNQQQQMAHIQLQNLSPEQRKKTKQMLLIQILNSVSSMNEQEYQEVVAKVVAMTEEQMNQSYTKLYALYMQNIAKSGIAPKYIVPTPAQFTASHS